MDKLFEDFMHKIESDPESKKAMDDMGKMFENVFSGMEGGEGAEGENPFSEMMKGMEGGEEGGFEKMTDMLLSQFMDKELLYEPLCSAKEELEKAMEKHEKKEIKMEEKDHQDAEQQLKCIDELIKLFDENSSDKEKMIAIFEKMNSLGSLFEIVKKYNPDSKLSKEGDLGGLGSLLGGGMPGMPQMPMPGQPGQPNPEECRLI